MSKDKYERDLGLDSQELISLIPALLRRRNEKGRKLINEALDEYQDSLIIDILQPLLSDWEKSKLQYSKEMFAELEAENKELRDAIEQRATFYPTLNIIQYQLNDIIQYQLNELKNKLRSLFHYIVIIENEQLFGGEEYKAGKAVAADIIVKMFEFFPEVLKEEEVE